VPASSCSVLFEKLSLSGTVLSVTSATLLTESKNGATSIIASAVDSLGSKCLNGGNDPSKTLEVIVLPSDIKPTNFSLVVVGASAIVTWLVPIKDLAASANVRARSKDVVSMFSSCALQVNSLTASRYLSVAASVIWFLFISTKTPVRVGKESSLPAAIATWLTAVANKSEFKLPDAAGSSGSVGYSLSGRVGSVNLALPALTKTRVPSNTKLIGLTGSDLEISASNLPGTSWY